MGIKCELVASTGFLSNKLWGIKIVRELPADLLPMRRPAAPKYSAAVLMCRQHDGANSVLEEKARRFIVGGQLICMLSEGKVIEAQ